MSKPPSNLITIYGRKPVLEALNQPTLNIYRVHLADSNKPGTIIRDIEKACKQRNIECRYHDRLSLSRISKNRKQDQGVAADIINPQARELTSYLDSGFTSTSTLMALDRVTNPQNLGMIIRSVAASGMDGLLLPRNGCAKLDALVVKASAGSLFYGNLVFCQNLVEGLRLAKAKGIQIFGMSLAGSQPIQRVPMKPPYVMVLGNETEGLSAEVATLCNQLVHIPMHNRVESLNVSVAAGILAFRTLFVTDSD